MASRLTTQEATQLWGRSIIPEPDLHVRIRIVTDEQLLESKGHKLPAIELYNDIIDTWISIEELSFSAIKRDLDHINHITELYIYKFIEPDTE